MTIFDKMILHKYFWPILILSLVSLTVLKIFVGITAGGKKEYVVFNEVLLGDDPIPFTIRPKMVMPHLIGKKVKVTFTIEEGK